MTASAEQHSSQDIIRSYLTIAGIYNLSASLIWGVNTLFLLDAGLDIAEVFIANAFYTVGTVLFEIPTGVLADTSGRRVSFLLSVLIVSMATVAYVVVGMAGGGLVAFCLASVLLGLGFTFYSGAVEAWLVDALDATGFEDELDHVFARGSMVTGAAMLIGSILGGVIGSIDLSLPYVGRAILLGLVFFFAYRTMFDLGYTPRALKFSRIPAEMRKLTQDSIRYGWQESHIRLLMMVSFVQFGFMMWAFYAWQPYFLDLFGDPNAVWIAGIIAALLSVASIIGNQITETLTHIVEKRTTIMIGGVAVFCVAMMGVGLTSNFYVAVTLFLIGIATTGVVGPVRQSYIHHLIPSQQRASVLSVDSMVASGGGIVSQAGLGQLSRSQGIAEGYIVGGGLTVVTLPILVMLRRRGGIADQIVGKVSHQGSQAGQGLPEVACVDSRPRHEMDKGAIAGD